MLNWNLSQLGVVAPDRVLSMGQIEQTVCKQMTNVDLMPNTLYTYISNIYDLCWAIVLMGRVFTNRMLSPKCLQIMLLATVIEGDLMAPFSIATIPGVREGATSFPVLLHFTIDMYLIMLSVKTRYQVPFLESLVWHNLGLNPGLLDYWRTLHSLG